MLWAQKGATAPRITVALTPTPADLALIVTTAHAVRSGAGVDGLLHTATNAVNQIAGPRRLHGDFVASNICTVKRYRHSIKPT